MTDPAEFDDEGQWIGPCPECGTNHDGYEPTTLGGEIRCLRSQAEAAGAGHLVDQIDAGRREAGRRRDEVLRREGLV